MKIEDFVQIFRIQESFDVPAQGSDGAHTWYVESPKSLTGFWALSRWYNTSRAFQDFRIPKFRVFVQIFVSRDEPCISKIAISHPIPLYDPRDNTQLVGSFGRIGIGFVLRIPRNNAY